MEISFVHWLRFSWATGTEVFDDRCAPAYRSSLVLRAGASRPRGLGRGMGSSARDSWAMAAAPPLPSGAEASFARRPLHDRRYRAAGEERRRGRAEAVLAGLSWGPAEA